MCHLPLRFPGGNFPGKLSAEYGGTVINRNNTPGLFCRCVNYLRQQAAFDVDNQPLFRRQDVMVTVSVVTGF
jgi:hypothetical protein